MDKNKLYSLQQMQLKAVVMVTTAVSLSVFLLYSLGGVKISYSTAYGSQNGELGHFPLPIRMMWILVMCFKLTSSFPRGWRESCDLGCQELANFGSVPFQIYIIAILEKLLISFAFHSFTQNQGSTSQENVVLK